MLKTSPIEKLDQLYSLFAKLPVNKALRKSFITLSSVREAKSQEEVAKAWTDLLDPTAVFKLLYCI
jgi:hypothetical protein